ncbi:MAG: RHS repeat-associated core domain-containing protein, partial [Formivibrio sp.]|nr:RHS repeat-associated core domain-containing protein [Formivibrio sp.]
NHYATLDHDVETDTDYAQFRQYSNAQGRWLSPDPYGGSYNWRNPQSFNRYAYVGNNPLADVDPSGQVMCNNTVCEFGGQGGEPFGGGGFIPDVFNDVTVNWATVNFVGSSDGPALKTDANGNLILVPVQGAGAGMETLDTTIVPEDLSADMNGSDGTSYIDNIISAPSQLEASSIWTNPCIWTDLGAFGLDTAVLFFDQPELAPWAYSMTAHGIACTIVMYGHGKG